MPLLHLILQRWRCFKTALTRWTRAIAYARRRLTAEEAATIIHDCEYTAGCFPLVVLDVEGTLNEARAMWHDHPALEDMVRNACDHVCQRHPGSDDLSGAARDWALHLVMEFAIDREIELQPLESQSADA